MNISDIIKQVKAFGLALFGPTSPQSYEEYDPTSGDYEPGQPFCVYANTAGDITLTGLDGVSVTYTVPATYQMLGTYKGIVASSSTVTSIIIQKA